VTRSGAVVRVASSLLLVAPLVCASALLIGDLRIRPTGRQVVRHQEPATVKKLSPGLIVTIHLQQDRRPYRGIVLHSSLTDSIDAQFRVCRDSKCEVVGVHGDPQHPLIAPLPTDTRGGDVSIEVLDVRGSASLPPTRGGAPQFDALQGFSWSLPLRGARLVFEHMAGTDSFAFWLVATIASLVASLAAFLWTGVRCVGRHRERERETSRPSS
jgi:hypothetical protein